MSETIYVGEAVKLQVLSFMSKTNTFYCFKLLKEHTLFGEK